MEISRIIDEARRLQCSDIHLTEGVPMMFRMDGNLIKAPFDLTALQTREIIKELVPKEEEKRLEAGEDVDLAFWTKDNARQRVNIFYQKNELCAAIRLLNAQIPTLDSLGLPEIIKDFTNLHQGLILVTGASGSGKSTSLAAMVDQINHTRANHVITIENPIEYWHNSDKALIHQREVGTDTRDFATALRSALREDPDIILVGEMRDYETIQAALTAAETGHLVLSTLHTTGAVWTIDRMITVCPPTSQNQIRTQLASVLKGIITQVLVPHSSGSGRVLATEVLTRTDAVVHLIRENKCHQLGTIMQSSAAKGMHTLNEDLSRLVQSGLIKSEDARRYSDHKQELDHYL